MEDSTFAEDLNFETILIGATEGCFLRVSGPETTIVQENEEGIMDSESPTLFLEHIFVPKPSDRTYIKLECALLFDANPKNVDCLGIDCEFAFLPDTVESTKPFEYPTARNLEKSFKDEICNAIGYSYIESNGKPFLFRFKFSVDYRESYQGKGRLRVLAPIVTIRSLKF